MPPLIDPERSTQIAAPLPQGNQRLGKAVIPSDKLMCLKRNSVA